MYQQKSCAANGARHQGYSRHLGSRSLQRASVNIYKTENSYEMLVFAPGRIKEHFHVEVNGDQLIVSYTPPEGFPNHDWVLREYSRGGFVRNFTLDESIDTTAITATYKDGVLQLSLPVTPGKAIQKQQVAVN